jgi:beta-glucosidase
VYQDQNAPLDLRVADLLGKMTLEEKIQQLNQQAFGLNLNANNQGQTLHDVAPDIGSLIFLNEDPVERNSIQRRAMEESRLGIPILFGFDTIHGMRTVYPIPLAQTCSWNPALVTQAAAMAARETKLTGIDWTFSPMIDVARDPRWACASS